MEEKDYLLDLERAHSKVPADAFNRQKIEVPALDVVNEGTQTLIRNFLNVAEYLNPDPQDLLKFILGETATSGSLDGQLALLKGVFPAKKIESLLQRYVDTYVFKSSTPLEKNQLLRKYRIYYIITAVVGFIWLIIPLYQIYNGLLSFSDMFEIMFYLVIPLGIVLFVEIYWSYKIREISPKF